MNSNICFLRFGLGVKGGLAIGWAPRMHSVSSLYLARHLHHGIKHVHGSNHKLWCCQGAVLEFLMFIKGKQWLLGWPSSVFASGCIILLCWFVLRLSIFFTTTC